MSLKNSRREKRPLMKKLSLFAISTLILTSCNTAPVALTPAPANLQAASVPQGVKPAQDMNARYGFRKPTAYLMVDLYVTDDKAQAQALIKEFFAKYVDKNDIFNYQTLQSQSETDKFTINIYGGNQDFVYKKLLPDLKFYLQQRMRFDKLSYYTGY